MIGSARTKAIARFQELIAMRYVPSSIVPNCGKYSSGQKRLKKIRADISAINSAAEMLLRDGFKDFYIEIAGDLQTHGVNSEGKEWSIGIRNPSSRDEVVKVLYPHGKGVATSGTYIRGNHIYTPIAVDESPSEYVSLTVIGPNIYEADRFATAAFAMGAKGIHFLESRSGFEAYAIDHKGIATMTTGFDTYTTI
jgi:thiamine biosynthesis lipoprotein